MAFVVPCGALAALLNFFDFSLGWGLTCLLGQIVALLCFRIFGPAGGALAFSIGSIATLSIWLHPWAWFVWSLEGIFLAFRGKTEKYSLVVNDITFWLFLGGPLIGVIYSTQLGTDTATTLSAVLKQSLNAIANAALAESFYLVLTSTSKKLPRISPGAGIIGVVLSFLIIPLAIFSIFINRNQETDLRSVIRHHLSESLTDVLTQLNATEADGKTVIIGLARLALSQTKNTSEASAKISDFLQVFSSEDNRVDCEIIDIREEVGAPLEEFTTSTYGLTRKVRFEFDGTTYRLSYRESFARLESIFEKNVNRELLGDIGASGYHLYAPNNELIFSRLSGEMPVWVPERLQKALSQDEISDNGSLGRLAPGLPLMGTLGSSVHYASALIHDHNFRLIVVTDPADLIREARWLQNSTLGVTLAIVLTAILLSAFIARWAERELSRLLDAIELLGGGNKTTLSPNFDSLVLTIQDLVRKLLDTESAAAKERERMNFIMETSPFVTYRLSVEKATGRVKMLELGTSASKVFGYENSEMAALGWWPEHVHPDDRNLHTIKSSDLKERLSPIQFRFRHGSGEFIWLLQTASLSSQTDEEAIYIGAFYDVTRVKEVELQLAQSSKLATLGELSAGIAHELNQPLSIIRLASMNLINRFKADQLVEGELERRVTRIQAQVDRATQIIDYLRDFGRTPEHRKELVSLNSCLAEVRGVLLKEFSLVDIRLKIQIPQDEKYVKGNATQLEQVMFNLLLNAKDAIIERRKTVADLHGLVNVEIVTENSCYCIVVLDNGGGIPNNLINKIFDPFITTKPAGAGTGLGLSISYGIIRDMAGSIAVENAEDGAKFTISLPQADSSLQGDADNFASGMTS